MIAYNKLHFKIKELKENLQVYNKAYHNYDSTLSKEDTESLKITLLEIKKKLEFYKNIQRINGRTR